VFRGLLVAITLLSAASIANILFASISNPSSFSLFESGSRVKMYLSVGNLLHKEYPNSNLLTSEIGGLGYSFQGKILDAAGLASPDALKYHPMKVPEERSSGGYGAIPPEYVRSTNPELIVSYDHLAEALLRADILEKYQVITIPVYLPQDAQYTESKSIWGSQYLRIYIRRDLSVADSILNLEKNNNNSP
jgi:hypothetical protein